MLRLSTVVVALVASTAIATAQWISQEQGGAFDNDPLVLLLTAKGGYAVGLRCKSDQSQIVFITQDRSFDRNTIKLANIAGPKLLVRVDRGEIRTLDAEVQSIDGAATFIADAEVGLYRAISAAKSSVAVAVELLGKKYHENSFGVNGSGAAMNKLITKCKLDQRG